jgi:anti-sigma B factor antagonist
MQELQISLKDVGEVTVVVLKGAITIGSGDLTLRTTIKDLVGKGRKKIVLDMADVPYMDSTGIGELVAAYTSAKSQKAEIKLANRTNKIKDLLGIVQLTSLFDSFDNTDEAVKSFG